MITIIGRIIHQTIVQKHVVLEEQYPIFIQRQISIICQCFTAMVCDFIQIGLSNKFIISSTRTIDENPIGLIVIRIEHL